jgi:uncharacterized membrane protein YgdD (TMEM256/DUF423 family)
VTATNLDVVALAETQRGKRYVWGAKPSLSDPDPPAFDCSGLDWWTTGRLGLPPLAGGTWGCKAACERAGTMIPVAEAVDLVGCLLGMDYPNEQHIVLTSGHHRTIEAKGVHYGVVDDTTDGRPWNWAARIPGCDYSPVTPTANPPLRPHVLNAPIVGGPAPDPDGDGYRLVGADGGVFTFVAEFRGGEGDHHLNAPIVGIASSTDGYWMAAADGGVFTFGDAGFFGSAGDHHLNQLIVGLAATPSRAGYWLVAADGGVFTFGDAGFYGSLGDRHLNSPVVAVAATPSGKGYWMAAGDGGVFSFGDAQFFGSMGAIHLNQPVVGIAATPTGRGYWLVAADGGIFAFGDAEPFGVGDILPSLHLQKPVVGCAASITGHGLYVTAGDGGVFAFGDAPYRGSVPELFT